MSQPSEQNPPAFPSIGIETDYDVRNDISHTYSYNDQAGMTLRDYFAAKAMNGLIINCTQFDSVTSDETLAKKAFMIADAMLAARLPPEESKK